MAYFKVFPTSAYANTKVVDITQRVALRRSLIGDPKAYLPYEVKDGMRADQVAQHYYNDPDNVWMVYMSAGIVDPYHEWYMEQRDFERHIATKYGSYENAVKQTSHWQLDWAADHAELTVGGYESLEPQLKKYWEAVFGRNTNILAYRRREEDWVATTNMVVRLEIEPQSNTALKAGDIVTVYSGPDRDGTVEVAWANTSVVKAVHVQANVQAGQVLKTEAGANAVVADLSYVSNTIPLDERPYWTRVSRFDLETARNESRKNIRLVDRRYVSQLNKDLKKILSSRSF